MFFTFVTNCKLRVYSNPLLAFEEKPCFLYRILYTKFFSAKPFLHGWVIEGWPFLRKLWACSEQSPEIYLRLLYKVIIFLSR